MKESVWDDTLEAFFKLLTKDGATNLTMGNANMKMQALRETSISEKKQTKQGLDSLFFA